MSVLSVVARLVFHCWDVGARRGAAAADDQRAVVRRRHRMVSARGLAVVAELYRYVLALLIALAMGVTAGVGPCSEQWCERSYEDNALKVGGVRRANARRHP